VNGHLQTALTAKAADTANATRDGVDRSTQSLVIRRDTTDMNALQGAFRWPSGCCNRAG